MPPDFLLFTRLPLLCFRGGIGTPLHAIVCGLFSAAGFFTLFTCLPLLCFCGGIGMRIPLAGMMGVVSYLSHEFLNLPQSSWLGQALQLFVQAEIEKRIRGRAHILALKERSCNEFWLEVQRWKICSIRQGMINLVGLLGKDRGEILVSGHESKEAQQSNSSGSEHEEEVEDHDELFVAHNDSIVIPETRQETILEFQQVRDNNIEEGVQCDELSTPTIRKFEDIGIGLHSNLVFHMYTTSTNTIICAFTNMLKVP
ncbi:hypothetical protein SUGI_0026380 [Cryptomeria japonica]|nr:hypothetical protein SUGI_0026380 [Cryptomeria japonica]